MSRATLSGLHVGSDLVFCTCSLSIDPTSHITGVTVSHELFRMNPSEPFAPSYRGTVSLIYPDQLSPLPFCHILHQCTSKYTGTPAHRSTQVTQYTGTPVQQHTGTPVHRYTSTPIPWYTGTPAHWYTGISVHSYVDEAIHWYIGIPIHRHDGTLSYARDRHPLLLRYTTLSGT